MEQARASLRARGIPFDEQRLFSYVKAGDLEVVRLLLAAGVQAGARNEEGKAALSVAASLGHVAIVEELLAAGADVSDLVESATKARPSKDLWDKVSSLFGLLTFVSTLTIATVGWYFTESYNHRQLAMANAQAEQDRRARQQEARIAEMETVEKMLPHLVKDEVSKRAALLAMSELASPRIAARMAELFGGEGSVGALEGMAAAQAGPEKGEAVSALAGIAARGSGADATAARNALGAIFSGKERALVSILWNGHPSCTGFVVDARIALVATVDYCLDAAAAGRRGDGTLGVRTWDGRDLEVRKSFVSKGDPIGLVETSPAGFVALKLADQEVREGASLLAIGYQRGETLDVVTAQAEGIDRPWPGDIPVDMIKLRLREELLGGPAGVLC